MIDIKRNLLKSYDEVQVSKFLFDNLSFYKRIDFWLLVLTILLGGLVILFTYKLDYAYLLIILYFIIVLLGSFLIINREYKKKLKKKKISTDKSSFKHWASEEYEIEKQKCFYNHLIDNKLLQNSKVDIELVREYEILCDEESNFFRTNKEYIFGGGIMILFILPVWSELIKLLLNESNSGTFIEKMKLILSLLTLIYMIIYFLFIVNNALLEFSNSVSRKYKSVGRLLRLIRLNLMILNMQSKNR